MRELTGNKTINSGVNAGIPYYQAIAKDFTPIPVSADFAALQRPNCLKKDTVVALAEEEVAKAA